MCVVRYDEVADELYGLLPEDFITARAAREKEVKAAGDRELAARIHALAKPNQVAWVANLLVREHREEVQPLLELGAGLREASEDLDAEQLREFSRQQHRLLHALVQQARRLAAAAQGRPASETVVRGLEETLRAALVDPDAADAVLSGRLTAGLQHSGFGPVTGTGGGGPSKASAPGVSRGRTSVRDDGVAAADEALAQAKAAAEAAQSSRDDATADMARLGEGLSQVVSEEARLREELDEAVAERTRLEGEVRRGREGLEEMERSVVEAERRLADAVAERTALDGSAADPSDRAG